MAVENLPLWTLLPNWRETVSETLTWASGVLASPSGAEQRFSLRPTPRRSFEASFLPTGQERAWADNAFVTASALRWYVPVFHDFGRTTAATVAASDTIPVETAGREFVVGGFVMLRQDAFKASVHEIVSVAPGALTVTPDVDAYPAGTPALPCAVMRLEGQPSMSRLADRTGEFRARFILDGPSPSNASSLVFDYRGYPVLATPPNESNDLTTEYTRILAEIANPLTRTFTVDTAGRNFSVQQHAWMVRGRTEQDALRGYFYALSGRRVATWVPTFAADFDLAATALSSATQIVVKRCGYTRFGGPRFGREDIRIELRSGAVIMRRITNSTEGADTETLTLDTALGTAVAPGDVKRISFMSLCRLDQDTVEFTHHTDKQGVLTARAAFKTAGEFRVAPVVADMPFPQGIMTPELCGEPPEPPDLVLLGDFYLYGDWTFPQLQGSERTIGWNAYIEDPTNSSGMPGGASGASMVVAPTGALVLRVSGKLVIQQVNGGKAGEYIARIERRAEDGEPWVEITSASVFLENCASTTCGPFAIEVPEETIEVLPGWQVRMVLVRPSLAYTIYNNDPALTYIEGSWLGELS